MILGNQEPGGRVTVVQVAFKHGMWWSMPQSLSDQILDQVRAGNEEVSYVWDWEDTRTGSFKLDDQETSYNRYIINSAQMKQTNTDNGRQRSIRIIQIRPEELNPPFTGELPAAR